MWILCFSCPYKAIWLHVITYSMSILDLLGGLEHVLCFHSIGKFIIPTDEVHHFSEGVGWNHQPGDHWKSFSSLIYPWIAWWIVPSFFGSRLPFRVNLHSPMGFPMGFPFSHGFPMVFPWFSIFLWFYYGFPMVSYGFPMVFHFPMVFLWFSHSFPMVFPWFSMFLWFSYGFPHEILVISMSTLESPGSSRFGLHSWPRCDGQSRCWWFGTNIAIMVYRWYNIYIYMLGIENGHL